MLDFFTPFILLAFGLAAHKKGNRRQILVVIGGFIGYLVVASASFIAVVARSSVFLEYLLKFDFISMIFCGGYCQESASLIKFFTVGFSFAIYGLVIVFVFSLLVRDNKGPNYPATVSLKYLKLLKFLCILSFLLAIASPLIFFTGEARNEIKFSNVEEQYKQTIKLIVNGERDITTCSKLSKDLDYFRRGTCFTLQAMKLKNSDICTGVIYGSYVGRGDVNNLHSYDLESIDKNSKEYLSFILCNNLVDSVKANRFNQNSCRLDSLNNLNKFKTAISGHYPCYFYTALYFNNPDLCILDGSDGNDCRSFLK